MKKSVISIVCMITLLSLEAHPSIGFRVSRKAPGNSNLLTLTAYDSVSQVPLGCARFQKIDSIWGLISLISLFKKEPKNLADEILKEVSNRLKMEGCTKISIVLENDKPSNISSFGEKVGIQLQEEGYIRRGTYCIP